MKAAINRALIEQTTFDSATPTGTAVVVHRFEQSGEYDINVMRDDEVIDRLRLNVPEQPTSERGEAQAAGATTGQALPGAVAVVDLASAIVKPATDRRLAIAAGGYVTFTAPAGAVRLGATVARAGAEEGDVEFDSRRLRPGDLFAVTLIRPGRYVATNTAIGASLDIQVTYPVIGSTPYRPPDPANVECNADGFSVDALTLGPAQGVVFHISTETRIQIELAEPDDGPSPATGPLASWGRMQRGEGDGTTGR
jgi:hypothetical protein